MDDKVLNWKELDELAKSESYDDALDYIEQVVSSGDSMLEFHEATINKKDIGTIVVYYQGNDGSRRELTFAFSECLISEHKKRK